MTTQSSEATTASASIEKNRWKDFLDDFSRSNEMRLARLEILSDELGASEEANGLPLLGVSFEEKGSETGDAPIFFGGGDAKDERHLTHTIEKVASITTGDADALEITGANGEKAILSFD